MVTTVFGPLTVKKWKGPGEEQLSSCRQCARRCPDSARVRGKDDEREGERES